MVNIIFLFNSNLIKLFNFIKLKKTYNYKINFIKIVNYVLYLKKLLAVGFEPTRTYVQKILSLPP